MHMLSNSNYSNMTTVTAGVGHHQRTSPARKNVQSIGQLIQQKMEKCSTDGRKTVDENNRRIEGFWDQNGQRKWGDDGGHGTTVQLVDSNNNAAERRNCWKGTNCVDGDSGKWRPTADADETDIDSAQKQPQFRCCAVCGGRIWQGIVDKKSQILGDCHQQQQLLKLDWGEELLVHSACFRCATCGLDLLGEEEQHVVKHADRFYCALHGQQQKHAQQQKQEKQHRNASMTDHGNANYSAASPKVPGHPKLSTHNDGTPTAWRRGATSTTMTKTVAAIDRQDSNHSRSNSYDERRNNDDDADDGQQHAQLQKWWERRAEEFNGGKGSTTFRYYGNSNGQQRSAAAKVPPPVPPKLSSSNVGIDNWVNNARTDGKTGRGAVVQLGSEGGHRKGAEKMANGGGRKSSDNNAGKERRAPKSLPKMGEERCEQCGVELGGSFVLAKGRCWCPEHFVCANSACGRRLLESGFVEEPHGRKNYCPVCYECLIAPVCRKCFLPLTETCLNALGEKWHNECFTCTHCRKPFGTLSFFVEDGKAYCEDDWNLLFTTKCTDCLQPIKVGQKWLEALGGQFHADCFKCATCGTGLEGKTYFERGQQPFCRVHATAASAAGI